MKMKLYYGALALLWLLSSCTPSSNVTDNYDRVGTCRNGHIKALTLTGCTIQNVDTEVYIEEYSADVENEVSPDK